MLIGEAILRKGERLIVSWQTCNPEKAGFPLTNILDRLTGNNTSVTDYVLADAAKCPRCKAGDGEG
jgi:hypothetical protein